MSPQVLAFLVFVASFVMAAEVSAKTAQNSASAAPVSAPASDQNSTMNSSSETATDKPAKKVWSNEDLQGLRDAPGNSAVVEQKAEPIATRQKSVYPKARSAKWYHDQIAALQARIPKLDNQIAQLQAGIDGKFTGNGKTSERPWGVRADDWSLELKKLQAQRADLMSSIDGLADEARHNGISENALP
jgi:hypothetical protein